MVSLALQRPESHFIFLLIPFSQGAFCSAVDCSLFDEISDW